MPLVSRSSPHPAARLQPDVTMRGMGSHRKVSQHRRSSLVTSGRHAATPGHRRSHPLRRAPRRHGSSFAVIFAVAAVATGGLLAAMWASAASQPATLDPAQTLQGANSAASLGKLDTPAGVPDPDESTATSPRDPGTRKNYSPMRDIPDLEESVLQERRASMPVRVSDHGTGSFRILSDSGSALNGVGLSESTSYRIEVERGLPVGGPRFAAAVVRTLGNRRSWAGEGALRPLVRSSGEASFRIVLASPDTTDRLCAPLDTGGRVSCRNGDDVVINVWRWVNGADSYTGDLRNYRRYVINHEVGHALGNPHTSCPGPGEAAPVMVQQTYGLGGCSANPWPQGVDVNG